MTGQHKESWFAWFASAVGTLALFAISWFYLAFHLWLRIALRSLVQPFLVLSVLVLCFAAAAKVSRERFINNGQLLPMLAAVILLFAAIFASIGFYARAWGYLNRDDARFWYIGAPLICIVLGIPTYYFVRQGVRTGMIRIRTKTN